MHYQYPMGPQNQAALAKHGETYANIANVLGISPKECFAFLGLKLNEPIYAPEYQSLLTQNIKSFDLIKATFAKTGMLCRIDQIQY